MDISEIVKEYRVSHELSMRAMADRCGVSHSYIAILENGTNPKTGEKTVPTTQVMRKLAKGMGITYAELLALTGEIEASETEFPVEGKKDATILQDDRRADSLRVEMIQRVMQMNDDELDKLGQVLDLLGK